MPTGRQRKSGVEIRNQENRERREILAGAGAERPSRALILVIAAALGIWLWVTVPLALGKQTFFFRDVFSLHLPLKAFGAAELKAGRVPALNSSWGLGQPYRGNPQTLAFYPGNVLYLALPFWSAFNLHFALHWLLAFLTMTLLARELGGGAAGAAGSWAAAVVAGLAYAGGGWMLTGLSFYHILTVSAWWPLAMWGALKGGRGGVMVGSLACGLALLGGEPLLAALGLPPLLWAAIERHGPRRGLGTAVAVGLGGLLVALPQVTASLRVLPFTFRGAAGVAEGQVTLYALHPSRLIELLLPLPFGWPAELGALSYWGPSGIGSVPLIMSLYPGAVALALVFAGARRRLGWLGIAAAGLLLAWLGASAGTAMEALSGGVFRFPEKFLFWPALALPLLAAVGLDRVLRESGRWARSVAAGAGLAALAALAVALAHGPLSVRFGALAKAAAPGFASAQVWLWVAGLGVLALLLAAAAYAARRASGPGLAALQLLALLQLFPLVMTTSTRPFRAAPPWAALAGRDAAVVSATSGGPFYDPSGSYRGADFALADRLEIAALDLEPTPGVLVGLTYPMAPDVDGLFSPLTTLMLYNLPFMDWGRRVSWMRILGVEALVSRVPPGIEGLILADRGDRHGGPAFLYRVENPAPAAWWPREVVTAHNPIEALKAVSRLEDPVAMAVAPEPVAHDPRGRVRVISSEPDRIELEIETAGGGLAVLRRAYQPLLTATAVPFADRGFQDQAEGEGRGSGWAKILRTMPVDLHLCGIVVPPGRHRVVLEVDDGPETTAAGVSMVAVLLALLVLLRSRRR